MNVMRTLGVLAAALACAAVAAAPAGAAAEHAEIIGGSAAPPGAWPSIAYLRGYYHDNRGREEEFACSGSVVAPQWILTAAHCTFGEEEDGPPERMVATLGVTDYTDPAGENIRVDRFVPNPAYDHEKLVGDVGLLHLQRATTQPPMPLATSAGVAANHYSSPPGVPNAAGWGAVDQDGTQLPTTLQQAYLQIRTSAQCSSLISGFDPNTETCAGTSGATGACFGDSGGPLVEIDSTTHRRALWGVTSYGTQTEEDLAACSVDVPAVFTWIPAYGQFIQSTIAGSATAVGSPPAPAETRADDATRATRSCRRARAAVTAARRRERRALRRLQAARRADAGAAAERRTKRARRSYRTARTHRRKVVATAARRCRY
jgi:secreted trypsin-like serine protease